jgi:hypothetical protein
MSIDPENIYVGCHVVFAFPENGWPADVKLAAKHLVLGQVYEVADYQIGQSVSRLRVCGHEPLFNSVHFEEYV